MAASHLDKSKIWPVMTRGRWIQSPEALGRLSLKYRDCFSQAGRSLFSQLWSDQIERNQI
jgi:hypothetical protein